MPEISLMARINSCGPFTHGYYEVAGRVLSHEGPLKGRAELLVSEAEAFLASVQEAHGLSREDIRILDVGAYDGWVCNQLWRRGFRNITALEPREHNVNRGLRLRSLLEIEDGVRHIVGTIENAEAEIFNQQFDVTLCFGVLHHLDNTPEFLRRISALTKHGALFETLSLADDLISDDLASAIEPKDLAYGEGDRDVSLFGVKLESSLLPGSTAHSGIVTIPGERSLTWMLKAAGFGISDISRGFEAREDGASFLGSSHRKNLRTSIVKAVKLSQQTLSPVDLVARAALLEEEQLHCYVSLTQTELEKVAAAVEANPEAHHPQLIDALNSIKVSSQHAPLISSIGYAPETRLAFEEAKASVNRGEPDNASRTLRNLVDVPNDDWRTTYRALFLLSVIEPELKMEWQELCEFCNPEFPFSEMLEALA